MKKISVSPFLLLSVVYALTNFSAYAQTNAPSVVSLELEQSTNGLTDWQTVILSSQTVEDGVINLPTNSSQAFYRLRIAVGSSPMVTVEGGTLPQSSDLAGTAVATFKIGRTEVTFGEWKKVRAYALSNGYSFDNSGQASWPTTWGSSDKHPVAEVSWYDVVKWCNAKSEQLGLVPVYWVGNQIYKTGQADPSENANANGYRLPKEAEWEWAARGGVKSQGFTYSGSNDPFAVAWFDGNSQGGWTRPVGTKAANELGIFDMSGNVGEWISDYVNVTPYTSAPRLVRGGGWDSTASWVSVSLRIGGGNADYSFNIFGFRLAKNR